MMRRQRAFTIVELLIIVVVIAILATISLVLMVCVLVKATPTTIAG